MTITVNDKKYETAQTTIEGFLRERGFEPKLIVVEYNDRILARTEWDTVTLKDGDVLQMAHMVAGG
ncbi:MAG: sulfur carrier protein ThiS [Armatimonadetes bacterium]|nr:sulfur carrier protein ThiS [Armatimonadota bacterium]